MKVVLDTNVWIAALISRGVCTDLVEELLQNHEIILSGWIRSEVRDVLQRKFDYEDEPVQKVTSWMNEVSTLSVLTGTTPDLSPDPDDNYVLQTAVEAEVDLIITGDGDLLQLDSFRDIPIIQPSAFWEP